MRFAGRRACTLPHRSENALSCAEVREGACSTTHVLHGWRSFLSCAIPCFVCALCAGTSCCCASFVSSAEVGVTRVASTRRAVAACGSDPHCALAAPRQRGHRHRNRPCRVADCAAKPLTACRSITTELCTLRLIFLEVCCCHLGQQCCVLSQPCQFCVPQICVSMFEYFSNSFIKAYIFDSLLEVLPTVFLAPYSHPMPSLLRSGTPLCASTGRLVSTDLLLALLACTSPRRSARRIVDDTRFCT
jgi:hypothetical protein